MISDAGTPGISDPGAVLIGRAIESGIDVISIPGPSALVAAISISGLLIKEFTFIGFLPPKTAQRQKTLTSIEMEQRTLIFYEAPHRIIETLNDMHEIFGDRKASVVKEITKLHEEVRRGPVEELLAHYTAHPPRGEITLVFHPTKPAGGIDRP